MRSKKLFFVILTLPILILAAGCKPKCENHEYATFEVLHDYPPYNEMVSYQEPITFEWHHNESCEPFTYRVTVKDIVGNISTDFGAGLGNTEITKSFDYSNINEFFLLPNREYEWWVTAFSEDWGAMSPPSQIMKFRTDGLCSAQELVPPVLFRPKNEVWLELDPPPDNLALIWEYPGDCFPEFYHYQLAADPNFTNIITSGITEFPKPVCGDITENCFSHHHDELDGKIVDIVRLSIPECSRIYWRVEARNGQASGGYSDVYRFTNASIKGCWQTQQSIDASLIKGYVFEDYCKSTNPYLPDGVEIWPPCSFGEYGVHANGLRARSAGENETTGEEFPAEFGIPGVIVDLGAGPCPSTGLDQFVTTESGNYFFMVQSPGEYCVSIDKANNPSLDHGIWTLPLTDQDITEATITFNQGDDLLMQFFGWDKNDYMKIDFWVELSSFCRLGDSKDHLIVEQVPQGVTIPIFARNEDATWFEALVKGKRCFISTASGEPAEDPSDLMIFPRQPDPIIPDLPTDPNTKTCSAYKSEETCMNHGCEWVWSTAGPGFCKNP